MNGDSLKGLLRPVLLFIGLAGVIWVWGERQRKAGADEALLRTAGDSTDARVTRLAADQLEREAAWARTQKRQNQEIAVIRQRADSLQNEVMNARNEVVTGADTLIPKPLVVAALDAKDSVIATANRQAVTYQSIAATYRDSVIPDLRRSIVELTAQREAWKSRSQRRFGCVGGPTIAGSLGGKALAGIGITCGLRFTR